MDKNAYAMRNNKLGPAVVSALESRHFEAYYCSNKEDALEKAISLIPKDHVIGWGGSASIREIGLVDKVYEMGYEILDRDKASSPEERMEIMRKALLCDTFLTSTNALSEDGQLVNIDGNGNRVAAMTFGPKSVIVIVGINKVVKTVEDAVARARYYAAPINVQRFDGNKTPCFETGACNNCKSADCVCSYLVTTRMCRPKNKIKVILVGEDIGF